MALAANFDVDLRLGVTGVDHVAAGTSDGAVHIVRMDALLHGYFTSFSIMIKGAILNICAHHNLRIAATSTRHPVRAEQPSERLLKHFSTKFARCQEILKILRDIVGAGHVRPGSFPLACNHGKAAGRACPAPTDDFTYSVSCSALSSSFKIAPAAGRVRTR